MRTATWLSASLTLGLTLALGASPLLAQSDPLFVSLPARAKALYYTPDDNPSPRVAVLTVHRTGDRFGSLECTELSRRGIGVLCLNTRFQGNEAKVDFEKIPLDIKAGVEFLKAQGVTNVLLWGHSGGGATTTLYQAVAEAGLSFCQAPNKLTHCDDSLAGMLPADGVMLIDAHPSNASNGLRAINPSVLDEAFPNLIDPNLDPFNPANGYNPNGASDYASEFVTRYAEGQATRLNKLIDRALYIREQMKAGEWKYPDDDAFIIPRGNDRSTNIFSMDPSIMCCTERPHKLIKDDGSIVTEIIKTIRPPDTSRAAMNGTFGDTSFNGGGVRFMTITSFLSANAIRATNSLDYDKIDWCSTNISVPCALETAITVPVLIGALEGHYFISDSEYFYDVAKSADKEFFAVEGAAHFYTPCESCQGGPYRNSVKNLFDYVAGWIDKRFPIEGDGSR
jgi:pimeloyl-ACP methyl ester carboxylesterase